VVKPRSLKTDEDVQAAVDALLGAFAAPEGAEPDDTAFSDGTQQRLKDGDDAPRTAPSADADALWGSKPKKR
jgi:hypothetical protein